MKIKGIILSILIIGILIYGAISPWYSIHIAAALVRLALEYIILNIVTRIVFKKSLIQLITDGFKSV